MIRDTGAQLNNVPDEYSPYFGFDNRQWDQASGNIITRFGEYGGLGSDDLYNSIVHNVDEVRVVSADGVDAAVIPDLSRRTDAGRRKLATEVSKRVDNWLSDGGLDADRSAQQKFFKELLESMGWAVQPPWLSND